jgi:hypothetical protein
MADREAETLKVPSVRFLHEQDGVPERTLKDRLRCFFRATPHVRSAYLVRANLGDQESVVLCLTVVEDEALKLLPRIDAIFAGLFNSREHLDIIFLDNKQEADLANVCKPFFEAS